MEPWAKKDMSAQLSQHVTTRLLIAEKSENAAFELDSALRDAGIATKLTISDDLAHIGRLLSEHELDVVLLNDKLDGLDQILPRFRELAPQTPLIILADPESPKWDVVAALELGATDMVPAQPTSQLSLVVKRELKHVCQRDDFTRVRRALKEAELRCQLLLQGSRAAIAYVHEGMHIHANEGYLDLFGYADVDDLCGVSLVDILSSDSAEQLKTQLKALRNSTDEVEFEFTGVSKSDAPIEGSITLTHSQYEGEECLQVTVRTRAEEESALPAQVTEQAPVEDVVTETDSALELSGFVKAADALIQGDTAEAYMLVGGLDNYRELQSNYGLVGVDTICRRVWQTVAELTDDFPAVRICNNQFAIAIHADNRDHAFTIADRVRAGVQELMFEVHDKTVRPTVSLSGIFVETEDGANAGRFLDAAYSGFLQLADAEKTNIVNIPSVTEDSAACRSDDARVVLRHINDAIDKKSFVLLFQPIISLRGDSDEHYEVFLRMKDNNGELIQPGRFLQTAIDNNVAGKIDRWVILQAIKMLSVHRAKGHNTRLTINLTANSVMDPEFLQWLGVAIKAARLPSDAVIFQITEKDATTYLRQTGEFINRLRDMHCRASLSRFGLIEEPFETLKHLPVDMVKLDGGNLDDIEGIEERAEELINTIKRLQGAGKLTVVPMVENANVLSTLWQAGANYIQGHYLQEPSTEMDYDFSTEE